MVAVAPSPAAPDLRRSPALAAAGAAQRAVAPSPFYPLDADGFDPWLVNAMTSAPPREAQAKLYAVCCAMGSTSLRSDLGRDYWLSVSVSKISHVVYAGGVDMRRRS
jgi:hypothetical protein